jgi:hypothetical protein
MKKTEKGCFGYLKRQRVIEWVKTVLYFALPIALFIMGLISTGTRKNLLTIVAVLGCLPASKSLVEAIMYQRAKSCSDACYEAVTKAAGDTKLLFDLYLTSYQKNFQISALAIKNNALCGYTEDARCDLSAGEKHITEQLQQSGYGGLVVKLFSDEDKFQERLLQLGALPEKNAEKETAIAQVICSISL